MSQIYTTRQRKLTSRTAAVRSSARMGAERLGAPSVPQGGMGSQLDELMQARIQQHFLDNQMPQAEQEADRLSAGLNARTPDEVKERLGERLGADFSNIRFHTDSGAARAAAGIGARAYATGGDIYFGQGGFDPSVAAHELVHTVQQGLVESSTPTVSAPTGQVQMMPAFLKKLGGYVKKGLDKEMDIVDRAGSAVGKAAKWLWRKTGGKLKRDNHDAMIELHEAMESGEWGKLDKKDQKAWIRRNPIAYRRYMKSKKVRDQTEARILKRQQEQAAAEKFLQKMGPVHSSALGGDGQMISREGQSTDQASTDTTEQSMDQASTDTTEQSTDQASTDTAEQSTDQASTDTAAQSTGQVSTDQDVENSEENNAGTSEQSTEQADTGVVERSVNVEDTGSAGQSTEQANAGAAAQRVMRPGDSTVRLSQKAADGSIIDRAANISGYVTDYGGDVAGIASGFLPKGLAKTWTGGISAGIGTINDGIGIVQSGKELVDAYQNGTSGDKFDATAGMLSTLGSGVSNVNSLLNTFGGPSSDKVGGSASAITGFINTGRGIYHTQKGFRQRKAMSNFMSEEFGEKTRDELEGDDLLYRDMAALGKMQGTKQGVEGASEIVTGLMDAGAGILDATGVGSMVSAGLHAGSSGIKLGTKIYSAYQADRMKKKVTEQTTGITDEKIKEFMKDSGIKNFSRAKQALMKAEGYTTGQRKELFADQTEKRSKRLSQDAAGSNARAVKLAHGLGVKADKEGNYSEDQLFAAMGGTQSRSQIVSSKFGIKARLADKRRREEKARRREEEARRREEEARRRLAAGAGSALAGTV